MKYILIILLTLNVLLAEMEVKDSSGLTKKELREKVKRIDALKNKQILLKDIQEIANADGTVDIKKLEALWKNLSPTPEKYDWVQTKSGEWFKGDIRAMFDDDLDFNSDEIDTYTFDMDDVTQIKSYHTINVNIDGEATFTGIVRLKDDNITIYEGNEEYTFPVDQVVSLAANDEGTYHFWSGTASLNFAQQRGNTESKDYMGRVDLQRRTGDTRLSIQYVGNIAYSQNDETENNQRVTMILDYYLSKRLFITPIYSEYYNNDYQNIASQYTQSIGIGYKFIDTKDIELYLSSGPGVIYTQYDTVYDGKTGGASSNDTTSTSATLLTRSKLDYDITDDITLTWDHRFTFADDDAGRYKHHMLTQLEIDLTDDITFNIAYTWDHLDKPQRDSSGATPYRDDYQTSMGLGVDF